MPPRSHVIRAALYSVAGGFVLYMTWPLLHGQVSNRSPQTSPTPVRTPRPISTTSREWVRWRRPHITAITTTTTTTTTEMDFDIPLDDPNQGIVVVSAWKQTNCGNTSDPLRINITHLEIEAGEHLIIGFDIELDIALPAPFQVNLTQWTMVSDDVWEVVPCGEIKGSCYLDDLCQAFAKTKCPALRGLVEPNMECPIQPGKYSVPDHFFPTVVEDYLKPVATRYHFKQDGTHIACYDLVIMAEKV